MKEYKLEDYQQLFSTEGMSYLTSDLFMTHYRTLGGIATFIQNKWTSFLPKTVIEETLKEGEETLSNNKKFSDFRNKISGYYAEVFGKLDTLLTNQEISREQCTQALQYISENWTHYSRTEFFYTDRAFEKAKDNETIQKNITELGELKNMARIKMNKLLFEPDARRKQLLRKLSVQFTIPFDDLLMYGKSDLLSLYDNVSLNKDTISDREKSYLMRADSGQIDYLQGGQSEVWINAFLIQNTISENGRFKGIIANKGKVIAKAFIVKFGDNAFARMNEIIASMPEGSVLVADTTAPELIMACKKASAIITNQGGMMSHAAIVSRELGIPCIVGLKNVTEKIKTGDMVEVDADKGIVRILK